MSKLVNDFIRNRKRTAESEGAKLLKQKKAEERELISEFLSSGYTNFNAFKRKKLADAAVRYIHENLKSEARVLSEYKPLGTVGEAHVGISGNKADIYFALGIVIGYDKPEEFDLQEEAFADYVVVY